MTIGGGRRSSTARAYLKPAMSRPNLAVVTGALTRRVVVEGGRAVGVEYTQGNATTLARASREVILSGGSYNSPQLLLLSGIGPAEEVAAHGITPVHDLPGVGKNLSEHPMVGTGFAAKGTDTFLNQLRFDRLVTHFLRYAVTRTGNFANQVITANAFVRTRPELDTPDMQLFFGPATWEARIWMPGFGKRPAHGFSGTACLLRPQSRGHVTLRSADPAAPPRVTLNFFKEEADRAAIRAGVRRLREVYGTAPLADLVKGEMEPGASARTDAEIDAYARQRVEVGHHPVGTCGMGTGAQAVVDPQLRVRGLAGLRVVDASVMPMVPSGNTNAPTIMIAEKAADMILGHTPLPAAAIEAAA
jgi:choline dehydrogenase